MDILIIGGLLVIGIGAIVALFFVLRSGNTPRTKVPEAMPQTAREAPPTPAYEPPAPQPEKAQNVIPQTRELPPVAEARTVPVADTIPQDGSRPAQPVNEKEQPLRVHLNGQFHELAAGLRSLQQQATEMEQRLSSLNHLLDGIERNQSEEK